MAALPKTLRARFAPIFSPLIEIIDLNVSVTLTAQDAAIFTSANGVQAAPKGLGRTAFCVGTTTTQTAQARGWTAEQAGTDANTLISTLISKNPTQRLVHLSGVHTRGEVAVNLMQAGLNVQHIPLYDQRLCGLTETATNTLLREKQVIVPLFSPRTAAQFVTVAPRTASVHVVAISNAVAAALGSASLACLAIATRPDAQAMGEALNELTKKT